MTPLEHIFPAGQAPIAAPLSPAVRVGNLLYVSGIPAYDADGKLAVAIVYCLPRPDFLLEIELTAVLA